MTNVQDELATCENRVAFARQAFNDAVLSFNNRCDTFRSNIIAKRFNFSPATAWVLEDEAARMCHVYRLADLIAQQPVRGDEEWIFSRHNNAPAAIPVGW
jgi:hypothetical protein